MRSANTTFQLYFLPNSPPAPANVTGSGAFRARFELGMQFDHDDAPGKISPFFFDSILDVLLTTDARDDWTAAPANYTAWIPDATSGLMWPYKIVFVERVRPLNGPNFLRLLLQRKSRPGINFLGNCILGGQSFLPSRGLELLNGRSFLLRSGQLIQGGRSFLLSHGQLRLNGQSFLLSQGQLIQGGSSTDTFTAAPTSPQTFTGLGSGSFTMPATATLTIQVWGNGGMGYKNSSGLGGGGGGSGGYSETAITNVPSGTVVYYDITSTAVWGRGDGTNSAPTTSAEGALANSGFPATSTSGGNGATTTGAIGSTKKSGAQGGGGGAGGGSGGGSPTASANATLGNNSGVGTGGAAVSGQGGTSGAGGAPGGSGANATGTGNGGGGNGDSNGPAAGTGSPGTVTFSW